MKLRRSLIAQDTTGSLPVDHAGRGSQPGPHISELDPAWLKEISESIGTRFADTLISHRRWPTCDQGAAIRAAGLIVDRAIDGIVAILDVGEDFKPYTSMIAQTINDSFWHSMPKPKGI